MSEKIQFEVQIEAPKSRHGWRSLGDSNGYFYFTENSRVATRTKTVVEARETIKKIQRHYKRDQLQALTMRIVKVTITTTYDIVE